MEVQLLFINHFVFRRQREEFFFSKWKELTNLNCSKIRSFHHGCSNFQSDLLVYQLITIALHLRPHYHLSTIHVLWQCLKFHIFDESNIHYHILHNKVLFTYKYTWQIFHFLCLVNNWVESIYKTQKLWRKILSCVTVNE